MAALALATWLYHGYRFNVWPQPGFLDYVYRFDGQLQNDWHTSLPPVHWAFTHALGALPAGAVETASFVVWLAGVAALWLGFSYLAESFGLTLLGALGAGLVAVGTAFGGVGISEAVFGYLYPTGTSFALLVCGLAALLRERLVLAGVLLGAATVVHPNLGFLGAAAIAPAVLLLPGERPRNVLRIGVPLAIVALPALAIVAADQTGGALLSAERRYELLVEVRQPHHMLFSAFPVSEYLRTGLWLAAGVAGLLLLWRLVAARAAALASGLVLVLLGAGAYAGETGTPLVVAQAQTSRLSPLLVLFGVLLGAGALARLAPRWAPALLLAAAALANPLRDLAADQLAVQAPGKVDWVTESAVEAGLLVAALAVAAVAIRRPIARPALASGAAALALAATAVTLVTERDDRIGPRPPLDVAYEDVAERAQALTRPGDLVLTPPDLDGFRDLARRPVVVEFGTFRYGKGDAEWVGRMNDLTGDPSLLEPGRFGNDVPARVAAIGAAYNARVAGGRAPVCRHRAKLVVARTLPQAPPGLVLVYRNGYFDLFGIREGTCSTGSA